MKRIHLSHFKYKYQYIRIERFHKPTKWFKVHMIRLKNYINQGINEWRKKYAYFGECKLFKGEPSHANK